jgi:hypothetical protein
MKTFTIRGIGSEYVKELLDNVVLANHCEVCLRTLIALSNQADAQYKKEGWK